MMAEFKCAPIIVFVFNRPRHTEETLTALSRNDFAQESELYIYADGPKASSSEEELMKIKKTREIIRSQKWCGKVTIVESNKNLGLADSIIKGVSEIVEKFGKIIVLEDDIRPEKGFLEFMNKALTLYQNDNRVMQVSGYIYPINYKGSEESFFLKVLSCWGWATWDRAWRNYVHDIDYHLSNWATNNRIKKFDIEGGAYFYDQLIRNKEKQIYTWAVRWYSSWILKDGFSLYPSKSLISNIGMDNSGVHCETNNNYSSEVTDRLSIRRENLSENKEVRHLIDLFFRDKITGKVKLNMNQKIKNRLKSILRRVRDTARQPFLKLIQLEFNRQTSLSYNNELHQNAKLNKPFYITDTKVGAYSYLAINSTVTFTDIGKFCSIGPNFFCGYGIHPTNAISTSPMFYSTRKQNGYSLSDSDKIIEKEKVIIGNDVFIGANVTILDGVSVSDGAIIAAGAVVVKNVPPYAVVGGVPASIIKYRFPKEKIDKLLSIKWWDWDYDKLKNVEKNFFNVDQFLNEFNNTDI